MSRKILLVLLVLTVVATLGWMVTKRNNTTVTQLPLNGITMTLYKSPYCGCCEKWGEYMEMKGYKVSIVEQNDLSPIKERFQVPRELESCHTTEVEGYVVEGHVPNEAIEKLLEERPEISGIGMAGMPSGSPGMPGLKEDFMVYEINHDGTKGKLFMKL